MGYFNDYILPTLVVDILLVIFGLAKNKFDSYLNNKDPRLSKIAFHGIFTFWIIFNIVFLRYSIDTSVSVYVSLPCFLSTVIILYYFIYNDLSKYWNVGVIGADIKTVRGIDYDKSLRLCKGELSFLGIGADKLSKSKEFESALYRCRSDKPIRFLLCDPSSEHLAYAAMRADKKEDRYQQVVFDSLRKIATLKSTRFKNIEVKFYKEKPIFRLMFIDDSICLMGSYASLGVDDGSSIPQLHFKNLSGDDHNISFYRPFEIFFDKLWDESDHWDFNKYLS